MASEEKTDKSSPTTSGPDSDVASVEELPKDKEGTYVVRFLRRQNRTVQKKQN